jgi:protease I
MAFAKAFFDAGKPVAAICRDPWTITEINAARGRLMTSCSSQSGNDQGVQRRP